jgi:hypothetical protein
MILLTYAEGGCECFIVNEFPGTYAARHRLSIIGSAGAHSDAACS